MSLSSTYPFLRPCAQVSLVNITQLPYYLLIHKSVSISPIVTPLREIPNI